MPTASRPRWTRRRPQLAAKQGKSLKRSPRWCTRLGSMPVRAPAVYAGGHRPRPPATRPRATPATSTAALAGGYDLSYPSLYKDSIGSGQGAWRVALLARSFPVVSVCAS